MSTYRLCKILGIVIFACAITTARADHNFQVADGENDIIVAATDEQSDNFAMNFTVNFAEILTAAALDSILGAGSGLDTSAQNVDLDLPADQDTQTTELALAGPSTISSSAVRDVLAPAALLLLGTAMTTYAFFTRIKRHHSRRAYYSRHNFVALRPSKKPALRTSQSAGSSGPTPRENNDHSSPRRRLA